MKSKKSFFNKTIFLKNVALYWPLWAVYTLFLFFMQTFQLWVENYNGTHNYLEYTHSSQLRDLIRTLNMPSSIALIAIAALCFGMAIFNYLYTAKNANMIHALPVDRRELFGTNLLSGLAFLIAPQVVVGILSAIVALCFGIKEVHFIGIWLLMCIGTDIVAFSIVTFCAMFTGLLVALPVYTIIVNFLSYWVFYLVYCIVTTFGYGVNSLNSKIENVLSYCSPITAFAAHVDLYRIYDNYDSNVNRNVIDMGVSGVTVILAYLVVAVVLYAIAYVLYQKRHIEHAGDLITVSWVKPIFRWGVGITGGVFGALVLREIYIEMGLGCILPVFILMMVVLGVVSYILADMLVRKTFHVFKRKNLQNCGVFLIVLLVCFGGLYGLSCSYEDYIPEKEEIARGTINLNYSLEYEGEELDTLIEFHEALVAQKDMAEALRERGDNRYTHISLRYELKNGEVVNRSYRVPYEKEEIAQILTEIEALEYVPETYMKFTFGKNYEGITEFGRGGVELQFIDHNGTDFGSDSKDKDTYYESMTLKAEEVEALYEAVLADMKAGTMLKYNIYNSWEGSKNKRVNSEAYLNIEYRRPIEETTGEINMNPNSAVGAISPFAVTSEVVVDVTYENWSSTHLNFGPDCENVVRVLIEGGYITSVEDVWWGSGVELK